MASAVNVDWTLLLATAQRFATLLGAESPPERVLRECIEKVLFGREAFEAARQGIISQWELVNLLLAHLHTLIVDRSNVQPEGEPWLDNDLLRDLHRALFGLDR